MAVISDKIEQTVHISEQIVRELMHSINKCGENDAILTVASECSSVKFEISLEESPNTMESLGYKTVETKQKEPIINDFAR